MNSAEKVASICSDLEPMQAFEISDNEARGVEITALHSIALSLKRIADSLQGNTVSATSININPLKPGGFFE